MRGGPLVSCLTSGLLQGLVCCSSAFPESSQDEGCPVVQAQGSTGIAIAIDSLEFEENAALTPEVRARLVDWSKNHDFHASSAADTDWQSELWEEIRTPFEDQGYFKIVVDFTSGLIRAEPHRLYYWVAVHIKSGPQYHLGEVRFENASGFTETALRAQVPLQQGDLFRAPKVREGLDNLRRLYVKLGYIDFTTEAQTDIDDSAHRIDLTLRLSLGAQYRIGALTVRGFDTATEKTLRSKFDIGQVFDVTAVHEFFKANSASLPSGTTEENGVTIARDAQRGTVGVVFEQRVCPIRSQR